MSDWLDGLAKNLAAPMPRSSALKLLGSALVGALLPGLAPSDAGASKRQGCGPCTNGRTTCGIPLLAGCTKQCCSAGEICCKWSGTGQVGKGGVGGHCAAHPGIPAIGADPRVVCCCPPYSECGQDPAIAPCVRPQSPCREPCGDPSLGICCGVIEYCSYPRKYEGFPRNGVCCKTGWNGCGPGGPASGVNWTFCCPPGTTCCGNQLVGGTCLRLSSLVAGCPS